MTPNDALERHLSEGLTSMAGTGAPDYLDDVLSRASRTRQRRAWLPFQRSVFPGRAPHERAGWTTGRFQQMTILKYAAVATLAVSLGLGLAPIISSPSPYLAAGPSPSSVPSPAASPTAAMAPAWVAGTIVLASRCTGPTATATDNGVQHEQGFRCAPQTWTTDDARLTGTVAATWSQDIYRVPDSLDEMVISNGRYDLQNDGGGWVCRSSASFAPYRGDLTSSSFAESNVCSGSGGYQGLSAVVVLDWTKDPVSITGVIFPGELPPAT